MFTPKQVTEITKIPASTIRRWAVRFEDFISPQEGRYREYTESDLNVFLKVRDLSSQGMTLDQIEDHLPVSAPPEDQTMALINLPDFINALEFARDQIASMRDQIEDQSKTIEDQNDQIQKQADQMQDQSDRLAKIEKHLESQTAWQSLPWYRRIFSRPPME